MRLSQKVNYEQWQPFYWQWAVLVLWYFNCTAKKKNSPMSLDISKSQEMTVANLTHSSREGVFSVTLPYPASAHRLRRCHRWVVGNAVTHVCYSVQVSYMTNVTRPFKARARTCAGCWGTLSCSEPPVVSGHCDWLLGKLWPTPVGQPTGFVSVLWKNARSCI